jgi:SOS-response transcriptional repressor LexA
MTYRFAHFDRMSLGRAIRAAREAKRISQHELGEIVGKGQTTISSWERDRTSPDRADAVKLISKLGMTIEQFSNILLLQAGPSFVEVPVLSWVSAGRVSDVGSLEVASADETVALSDLPAGEYFITEVVGDSMDRVSPEGSRVVVNVSDKRLIPGKAYIFSLRGETTYKFYQRDPIQRLEPFSTNPSNRTIYLGEEGWSVVGRVFRSWIDLR